MISDTLKGLVIFVSIWGAFAFTLAGCMERQLKKAGFSHSNRLPERQAARGGA
jgi:hypothetical protein